MVFQVTSDYISLLNKAVSRELQVSVQYMLQHTKMEKLMRKVIPENILLEKTTYEAIGKFLKDFAAQEDCAEIIFLTRHPKIMELGLNAGWVETHRKFKFDMRGYDGNSQL